MTLGLIPGHWHPEGLGHPPDRSPAEGSFPEKHWGVVGEPRVASDLGSLMGSTTSWLGNWGQVPSPSASGSLSA